MMTFSVIGLIGPIVMTAICWALFRKAGLRGGIFAATALPIIGVVTASICNLILIKSGAAGFGIFAVSSVIATTCFIAPLVVLLFKDWPALGATEVFK